MFLHDLGFWVEWKQNQKNVLFLRKVVVRSPSPFVVRTTQNYHYFFYVAPKRFGCGVKKHFAEKLAPVGNPLHAPENNTHTL